jgi:hypothetical protein
MRNRLRREGTRLRPDQRNREATHLSHLLYGAAVARERRRCTEGVSDWCLQFSQSHLGHFSFAAGRFTRVSCMKDHLPPPLNA